MTLLAVFKILLFRYTGQSDIAVGVPIANRRWFELEKLIGTFVNTLVLRTNLSQDETFDEALEKVKWVAIEAFEHQDISFAQLVSELQPERDRSHSPFFDTMFNLINVPMNEAHITGIKSSILPVPSSAQFDLTCTVTDVPGFHIIEINYNSDLFEPGTIQRMLCHYVTLLEAVFSRANEAIGVLPFLTGSERHTILEEWNATQVTFPALETIPSMFEAQVDRTPSAIAASAENGCITFAELDSRANALARYLRGFDVGPETLVGLCLPRSFDMLIGLLAIQKAGGAYLPLDPRFPPDRLTYMLQDSRASILLTNSSLAQVFPNQPDLRVICLDRDAAMITRQSSERLELQTQPENLAYVLYTSGSTGHPKGVQVLQRNLVNFLLAMMEQPGLSEQDILLSVTTLSFDIAGLEIYLPLITGARLVLVSADTAADGPCLRTALENSQANVMQATPTVWRALISAGWQGSSTFKALCGGEALPIDLAAGLLQRCGSLWNMYGPTETTIWSTLALVSSTQEPINIGRPIANTQVYILDPLGQPSPIGVPGELSIGGAGVARGYLNRPELTAEKFVPDPFSQRPSDRLYRTGDLARFLPDGRIDLLGRIDNQIKLHGFRIELGEIHAALMDHPDILEAAVVGRKDQPDTLYLAAYVVAKSSGKALSEDDLRFFLSKRLPTAMIPARYVFLDELPQTPNGKVNHKALPAPSRAKPRDEALTRPRDEVELKLTQIWKKLLGVDQIGIQDDFFQLGGHSLLAVRMFNQIKETFCVTLPLTSLFNQPTIEHLANLIHQNQEFTPWSSLSKIQPLGNRPPFFCVHGMPGDVFWYCRLTPHMSPDQPIWGLESQGLDGIKEPLHNIEKMAALYIQEMKSIQPEGPYYLCGYSFGGTVAFEIARQIEQMGEKVALLAVIDHATPKSGYYRCKFTPSIFRNIAQNLPYRISDAFHLRPDEVVSRIRRYLSIFIKKITGKSKRSILWT